jgi:predicted nucleotidyltransferase
MKTPKSLKKLMELLKPLKNNIQMMALFGSYARGDYHKDSDIDVLVVSKSRDYKLREKIVEAVDRSMEEVDYNELISPIIMDVKHFGEIKKLNTDLYHFLNKEGKILWQAKT